jgi:hypothetical protein
MLELVLGFAAAVADVVQWGVCRAPQHTADGTWLWFDAKQLCQTAWLVGMDERSLTQVSDDDVTSQHSHQTAATTP